MHQTGENKIKIYFCGSIRGGRELASTYEKIIRMLGVHAQVLTEHLGDDEAISGQDALLTDREIHDRDLEWVKESDMVVAEVTVPSLGVGYEIGRAVEYKKPVLCLFQQNPGKRLSAMIGGCPGVAVVHYKDPDELPEQLRQFINRNAARRIS